MTREIELLSGRYMVRRVTEPVQMVLDALELRPRIPTIGLPYPLR